MQKTASNLTGILDILPKGIEVRSTPHGAMVIRNGLSVHIKSGDDVSVSGQNIEIIPSDSLDILPTECHQNARDKKFYEDVEKLNMFDEVPKELFDALVVKRIALIITELGEAIEALRTGKRIDGGYHKCLESSAIDFPSAFRNLYKDTFEDELADTFIRLFDLCGFLNIPIKQAIHYKMRYNETREAKHGKEY